MRRKKIPSFLMESDFKNLLFNYMNKSNKRLGKREYFARIRNSVLWQMCFYLGLRPKEAKDILISDLDLKKGEFFIRAENNKQRNNDYFPLQRMIKSLRAYIKIKDKIYDSPYLFPSIRNQDKSVSRHTLIKEFRKALELSNMKRLSYIDKQNRPRWNLSMYSLRHSFGTFAMHSLKDVREVADLMRQYDPQCRSTFGYIHTDKILSREHRLEKINYKI